MSRKGFPESYDVGRLLRFVDDVKSGRPEVAAPVYSHLVYDVLPDETKPVRQPDVMILEGLNVLQTANGGQMDVPETSISDFFDFSIYVDADDADLERWYVDRFLTLRDTVFQDKDSYFNRYASLSTEEAKDVARGIWAEINGPNLVQNIKPTRERARLILEKSPDHSVRSVKLRKL
jgi:type I pantothenate kinase